MGATLCSPRKGDTVQNILTKIGKTDFKVSALAELVSALFQLIKAVLLRQTTILID